MSSAYPLSTSSTWFRDWFCPRNALAAVSSSEDVDWRSIRNACSDKPFLSLISSLCFCIVLHFIRRWNSSLLPEKHSGHCRTLPPSWQTMSAVRYESRFPNPAFIALNLEIALDHLECMLRPARCLWTQCCLLFDRTWDLNVLLRVWLASSLTPLEPQRLQMIEVSPVLLCLSGFESLPTLIWLRPLRGQRQLHIRYRGLQHLSIVLI